MFTHAYHMFRLGPESYVHVQYKTMGHLHQTVWHRMWQQQSIICLLCLNHMSPGQYNDAQLPTKNHSTQKGFPIAPSSQPALASERLYIYKMFLLDGANKRWPVDCPIMSYSGLSCAALQLVALTQSTLQGFESFFSGFGQVLVLVCQNMCVCGRQKPVPHQMPKRSTKLQGALG